MAKSFKKNAQDFTPDEPPMFNINDKVRRVDYDGNPTSGICVVTGVRWCEQIEGYYIQYLDTSEEKNPSLKIAPEDVFTLIERA